MGIVDADSLVDLDTTVAHVGAYIADFLTVWPRVTISGSARFTHSALDLRDRIGTELSAEHRFNALNPAAGVAVDVGLGLTTFAGYSVSSRVPTPSELGCADPDDPCRLPNAFVSDPPLEQVRAHTIEAGLRGRGRDAAWSGSVFRTINRNDLLFISSGALSNEGYFANIGDTTRSGFELSASGVRGPFAWAAAYTYLRALFADPLVVASENHPDAVDGEIAVEPGDRLPSIPRHTAKVDGEWSIGRVSAGFSGFYLSSQVLRGDEANLLGPLDGYFVASLRGRVRLHPRMTLVAHVTNLFNSDHATFGLLGEADDVLGDEYDDPRFLTPAAARAAWVGLELSLTR
jgi:outer membrane receptor protein involved in Fe transport